LISVLLDYKTGVHRSRSRYFVAANLQQARGGIAAQAGLLRDTPSHAGDFAWRARREWQRSGQPLADPS